MPGLAGQFRACRGRVDGSFFNGGGGTIYDDVLAFITLDGPASDPPGAMIVAAFLQYQKQFFGYVPLGLVNIGEPVIAELKWDKPNHRFIARLFTTSYNT